MTLIWPSGLHCRPTILLHVAESENSSQRPFET